MPHPLTPSPEGEGGIIAGVTPSSTKKLPVCHREPILYSIFSEMIFRTVHGKHAFLL